MSVTSTMTESLRMVRNQESFLLLFVHKRCFYLPFNLSVVERTSPSSRRASHLFVRMTMSRCAVLVGILAVFESRGGVALGLFRVAVRVEVRGLVVVMCGSVV